MWETQKIEELTKNALIEDLGQSRGDERFGLYTIARKRLVEDILGEIKGLLPNLTDHGPNHIANVLKNAEQLLGDSINELNSVELYCLILSILFHDVGNFFDRKDHQKRISPIYDYARPNQNNSEAAEEKKIILKICEAHCGKGLDGSWNTLQDVPERFKLEDIEVRANILAPILRMADELAEGAQRTSQYMLKFHDYPEDSFLHHQYSNATKIDIDRENGRLRLTYHIRVTLPKNGDNDDNGAIPLNELDNFLFFVYNRIEKLNQERQYTKFYCKLLSAYQRTSITINFWYKNNEIGTDLQQVILSDLVVPGDDQKKFMDYNSDYKPSLIKEKLEEGINRLTHIES